MNYAIQKVHQFTCYIPQDSEHSGHILGAVSNNLRVAFTDCAIRIFDYIFNIYVLLFITWRLTTLHHK
jgi:hypothetical protein